MSAQYPRRHAARRNEHHKRWRLAFLAVWLMCTALAVLGIGDRLI